MKLYSTSSTCALFCFLYQKGTLASRQRMINDLVTNRTISSFINVFSPRSAHADRYLCKQSSTRSRSALRPRTQTIGSLFPRSALVSTASEFCNGRFQAVSSLWNWCFARGSRPWSMEIKGGCATDFSVNNFQARGARGAFGAYKLEPDWLDLLPLATIRSG